MTLFWGPIFEAVLLWLTALLVLSIVTALLYPLFSRINNRYVAERRSLALLVYALMTPTTATLLWVVSLNPGWAEYLIGTHCHSVDCLPHRPQIKLTSWVGMSMLIAACIVLLSFSCLLRQQWVRSRQRLRVLQALSASEKNEGYSVLSSPALIAWCVGFFRSRIYLSSGLISVLDDQQIKAVLAHERAHAGRLDNLRRWAAYISTVAWPGSCKKKFWQDFFAAAEEACDRSAAKEMRSYSPVIEALSCLASAGKGQESGVSVQPAHDPLMRIRVLRSPRGIEGFPMGVCLAIMAMTFLHILLLTSFVHHLLEHSTGPMLQLVSGVTRCAYL